MIENIDTDATTRVAVNFGCLAAAMLVGPGLGDTWYSTTVLCAQQTMTSHRHARARSRAADETLRDISPPREIPPFAIKFKLDDVESAADPQNGDY